MAVYLDHGEGDSLEYRGVAVVGGGDQQRGDSGGDELPDLLRVSLGGLAICRQHELGAVVADTVIYALHDVGKKGVGDLRQNQPQRDRVPGGAPGLFGLWDVPQLLRGGEDPPLALRGDAAWLLV